MQLTQQRIKEVLRYEENSGKLFWLDIHNNYLSHKEAGSFRKSSGYIMVQIDKKVYLAHRVIWMLVYGKFPDLMIDHVNGIKSDNRLSNLREVTKRENSQNIRVAYSSNKSCGLLGVSYHNKSGKWLARICSDTKRISLGLYDTPEEAHAAYLKKKRERDSQNL